MTQNYEPERHILLTLLRRWQSGELSERQVHQEAERIWAQGSCGRNWWKKIRRSIVATPCILDSLNAEWVIAEDVPAMLSFLNTEPEDAIRGWSKWRSYWDHVDFASRKHQLESNPYYAKAGPFK